MADTRPQNLIDTDDTLDEPPEYSNIVAPPLSSTSFASTTITVTTPLHRPPTPPRPPSPDVEIALRNFKQTQPPTNRFVLTSSASREATVASIILDPSATPPADILFDIPLKVSTGPLKGEEFPPKGRGMPRACLRYNGS
ncbi:hypothetical protein BT69DRAFT_302212 [Atractiella rhizophila]|nr:hypothetical protein BT69DRAFT_302212 [Atractiella rhizophila]